MSFYDQPMGTGHLAESLARISGRRHYLSDQPFDGVRNGKTSLSWSIRNPDSIHQNRFALLREDIDAETLRTKEIWRTFYEPNGISDQMRSLFYRDGVFVGYVAGFRGDGDRFTRREKERLNSVAEDVRSDLVLAHSLENARDGVASCHVVCDEDGKVANRRACG